MLSFAIFGLLFAESSRKQTERGRLGVVVLGASEFQTLDLWGKTLPTSLDGGGYKLKQKEGRKE